MNKTDLMKDLHKVLKESGWLSKATEHFRVHPEYYEQSKYAYIANLELSVSFQPGTLQEVQKVNPIVLIEFRNGDVWNSLSIHKDRYTVVSTRIKNGNSLEYVTWGVTDAL